MDRIDERRDPSDRDAVARGQKETRLQNGERAILFRVEMLLSLDPQRRTPIWLPPIGAIWQLYERFDIARIFCPIHCHFHDSE
jgi:hypothetical protein